LVGFDTNFREPMCQEIWAMRIKNDTGSGSVLGLGLILGILGIITLGFSISNQSLAKSRLQAETDSAALAAEDVLRGIASGYPCETAEEMVKGFGGVLESCHIVNLDIYISVYQENLGIVQRVKAHAGVGLDPTR